MRTMTLLLCLGPVCLGLAGCAGASASHDLAPAAASEPAAPNPAAASARASAQASAQASAEAGTRASAHASAAPPKPGRAKKEADQEEWWKEGGITKEKISAMCWMKYEKGRKDLPIDKRADLVNACVDQALKEHPLQ